MSNRRRLAPPAAVTAYTNAYKCPDCRSRSSRPRLDKHGVWQVSIAHDETCPSLTGVVSRRGAAIDAALAVATSISSALIVTDSDKLNEGRRT